jgi:hypothetical protein
MKNIPDLPRIKLLSAIGEGIAGRGSRGSGVEAKTAPSRVAFAAKSRKD